MKKLIIISLLLLMIACSEKRIIIKQDPIIISESSFEFVKDMKIGINLGNSLEAMSKDYGYTLDTETFWSNPKTTKEMIDYIKELGFRTIRIPISYYNHLDENKIIDERWFDRIEEVINWALDNDLYTIINIHHDTGMDPKLFWIYADSEVYEQSLKDYSNLWRQIADRFKDYDHRLIFQSSGEWMNKDRNWNRSDSMDDFKIVHELNQAFIDIVRDSGGNNSNRYLMISPFAASGEEDIIRAMFYKPFNDSANDKLILSIHTYEDNIDEIKIGANYLKQISSDYNIPIIIDECGIRNKESKSKQEKIIKEFLNSAKEIGITCLFWDDGYDYKIFDRNKLKIVNINLLNEVMEIIYK